MSGEIHLDMHATPVKLQEQIPADDGEAMPGRYVLCEDVKSLLHALDRKGKEIGNGTEKIRHPFARTVKVFPRILLQDGQFEQFQHCYEPQVVKFGPLSEESELKIKLAAKFVKESGAKGECFLTRINEDFGSIMECYGMEEDSKADSDTICKFFLDGCSMLQFMRSYAAGELREFNISNHQAALIQQDLFLLTNQIPFRVLTLLMGVINSGEKRLLLRRAILIFVMTNNIVQSMGRSNRLYLPPTQVSHFFETYEPVHLLDLLYTVVTLGNNLFRNQLYSVGMQNNLISKEHAIGDEFRPTGSQICSFRNVQELKSAGIKLKPNESGNLKGLCFTTRFFVIGHLKLPSLIVDSSTLVKLLNLMAYETSFDDYETNCVVTSYVNFLDLLIDNEQDVKEMRAAHVICNRLSSDAEVAQLINDLGSHCLPPPADAYWNVKDEIQTHYERRCAIWIAQVYQDHFRSPWTILALLAAATILFLTATQTWYTVHPR